jgi:hypothetical protein
MARRTIRKSSRKRKKGGINKLFTIYTTGMLNIKIIDVWLNNGVLDRILECIPETYDKIQISHFDPSPAGSFRGPRADIERLIVEEKRKARIIDSTFLQENFPIETIAEIHADLKNYIIIDNAHILRPTGRLKEFNYTPSHIPANPAGGIVNVSNIKTALLNAIYLGYPLTGDIEPFKFFDVRDEKLTTFKDKLSINGWPKHFMYDYPGDSTAQFIYELHRISSKIVTAKYKLLIGKAPVNINALDALDLAVKSDVNSMAHDYLDRDLWLDEPVINYRMFIDNLKDNIERKMVLNWHK